MFCQADDDALLCMSSVAPPCCPLSPPSPWHRHGSTDSRNFSPSPSSLASCAAGPLVQNPDKMFAHSAPAAVLAPRHPRVRHEVYNAGAFVLKPSRETFFDMVTKVRSIPPASALQMLQQQQQPCCCQCLKCNRSQIICTAAFSAAAGLSSVLFLANC